MSFEEEFDSIMRRKSEEMDYPFDEKNWEKARAMLDAERDKVVPVRSIRNWRLPAIAASLALVSGLVILFNAGSSDQAAKKPLAAEEQNEPSAGNTNVSGSENVSGRTTASKTSDRDAINNPAEKSSALPASSNSQAESSGTTLRNASAANNNELAAVNRAANRSFGKPVNERPVNGRSAQQLSTAGDQPASREKQEEQVSPETGGSGEQPVLEANGQKEDQEYVLGAVQTEQLSSLAIQMQPQADPEIIAHPLNRIKRYDEDYVKKHNRTKTHFFNVEAGGTYLLGWNTPAGKDGKGLDWYAGVNYGLYLSHKISIGLGVQGYNIKNITQAFFNGKNVQYDFGSVVTNTVITSNNLYYVAVPLKLSYELSKSNQFALGANFGYLMDSRNTIETYQTQDNVTIHSKPVKNSGVYQSANSLNVMLSASYRTEIVPRLYINTELLYGVSDIFKNSAINSNKEQVMGLRIGLQYTLFDK